MSSSPVISLGPWGGPDGKPWSCKASNGIKEIIVRDDNSNIKSFSFIDADGLFTGTFGGDNPHPAARGKEKKVSIDWPSEHLISISGHYGNYEGTQVILSLSFTTNLKTYGPFGSGLGGEVAFSSPIVDGGVVAGFYGRSNFYVNSIGIYTQPANPGGSFEVGPWGGSGGGRYKCNVDPSYIKQISITFKENVKAILFKDADGRDYGPFGRENPEFSKEVIVLGDNERLTSISGAVGVFTGDTVVMSLSFITTNTTYGPYGTQSTGTTPFSIPIQGSEVVGFFGNSGLYLDSIGVFLKPMDIYQAAN